MSRGNQRDTDRAKNQAKLQAVANQKSKVGLLQQTIMMMKMSIMRMSIMMIMT